MKALLWKEFHENLKWAGVPLLLMFGRMLNFGTCLCDTFFMYVSLVSAVFGGALGILQMTFESHGDRRALLLHRPIGRTRIFLAKVAAGTALYLLALGLPLAFYLATSFIPGHVARLLPLSDRWPLVFPWFADVLTGLVYYLAGALAGLRPGRWYGSRGLGFPVALLATFLAWNLAEFREVLVALVVLSGLVGLAAWGSFLTAGDTDSQPMLAKFGMAVTFLIGLSVLSLQAKTILEFRAFRSQDDYYHAFYQINRDGQVLIVEQLADERMRVRDLAGRELEEFRTKDVREAQIKLGEWRSPSILTTSIAWNSNGRSYRTIGRYLVRMSNQPVPPGEGWCYAPGLGLLVGYDFVNGKRIGSIGPDGFAADGEMPRSRFRGVLDYSPVLTNPDYLVFPGGVYAVDFEQRHARLRYAPAVGEIVLGAQDWRDEMQRFQSSRDDKSIRGVETNYHRRTSTQPERTVVGTSQAISILDSQGNKEAVFPVAYDSRQYMMLLYRLENPERYLVYYAPSYFLGLIARESMPSQLVEYASDGRELSRRTLPALPWQKPLRHQPWFGALTSPAEAVILLGSVKRLLFKTERDPQVVETKFQKSVLEEFYRILPFPLELADGLKNPGVQLYVLGLAFNAGLGVIGCFWLSRRLAIGGSDRALWIAGGLVFGVVGAFLLASVREWPARVACPQCRQLRLVTRDLCEHCGAQHPAPTPDGTEIFAATAG